MVSLGSAIYSATKPIFRIYLIIGLGFLLGKLQFLSVEVVRNLSNLVLVALLPCLIFTQVVTNISDSDIKNIGIIVLSAFLMYAIAGVYSVVNCYVTPVPKKWRGGAIAGGILPNVSDLPIAFVQNIANGAVFSPAQGDKGVAYIIIFLATYILVQFNCGLFQLTEWDFKQDLDDEEASPKEKLESASSVISTDSDLSQEDSENLVPRPLEAESHSRRASQSTTWSRRRRASIGSRSSSVGGHPLAREYSRTDPYNANLNPTVSIITESNLSRKDITNSGKSIAFVKKYKLHWLVFLLKNFLKPCSIALILSITVAMIPWVKALFVQTSVYMPSAPDNLPPLSFFISFTSYVGQASVPVGLLLLGATIASLEVKQFSKGFLITVISLTTFRLCILPIIGVCWVNKLKNLGWVNDDILTFVLILEWALPSATVQVYFTAANTDPNAEEHVQLDCLAIYIMAQYIVLAVSLPFVVTYTIKVNLGM